MLLAFLEDRPVLRVRDHIQFVVQHGSQNSVSHLIGQHLCSPGLSAQALRRNIDVRQTACSARGTPQSRAHRAWAQHADTYTAADELGSEDLRQRDEGGLGRSVWTQGWAWDQSDN